MKTNTKQTIMTVIFAGLALLFAGAVSADSPYLVDQQTGKYLGNLNSNQFDPNSVSNPYGQFGSKYSPDSINNNLGTYGSPYSNSSVNNPYATGAPAIIHNDH